jgi:hypothetical protein
MARKSQSNGWWVHRERQNHVCDVGVGMWLDQEKAWLVLLVG